MSEANEHRKSWVGSRLVCTDRIRYVVLSKNKFASQPITPARVYTSSTNFQKYIRKFFRVEGLLINETIYYFITSACDGCSECMKVCDRNAITPGTPYYINPGSCNACGNCAASCSHQAILPENDPYRLINRESDSFFGGGVWMIGRKWWESDTPNQ